MNILLGDMTAFRLWRIPSLCAMMREMGPAPMPQQSLGCRSETVSQVREEYGSLSMLPLPLDLFVTSKPKRRKSKLVSPHVIPAYLANEQIYRLGRGVFVCSPRMVLLQLAKTHSVVELALAASELCGSYGRPFEPGGQFMAREPLASCGFLRRFANRQPGGTRGKERLLRALDVVSDGAASPMETIAALLFAMPGTQGGYGLKGLRLNYPLEVPGHLRQAAGRSSVRCDLYYPASRVAVEYDSDQFHRNADRIGSDSKRRTALELMGVHTVSLTRTQLMSTQACDAVAAAVARRLGRKLPRVRDFKARQADLRTRLLDFGREL